MWLVLNIFNDINIWVEFFIEKISWDLHLMMLRWDLIGLLLRYLLPLLTPLKHFTDSTSLPSKGREQGVIRATLEGQGKGRGKPWIICVWTESKQIAFSSEWEKSRTFVWKWENYVYAMMIALQVVTLKISFKKWSTTFDKWLA